jgi:hypothetical protein
MRSLSAAVLLTIFLWIFWLSPVSADGLVSLNVNIPPGKWKGIRLRNLPKDAGVAVQVVSSGEIIVALVDSRGYQRFSQTSRPLFIGQVEKRLAFSVSIPVKGDYFVVLDNRSGQEPRAVTVTVRATRAVAGQIKAAEEILKRFEQQLHQLFVFDPFPIGIKPCGVPKAFVGTSGIVLCTEYIQHLYDILKDQKRTENTLSFSIFHEVARMLLSKWNHPFSANEEVADEFATVLMVMLNQKERVITIAEYFVKNQSASETLLNLFGDDRHPLSVERAKNILSWAKDPQLVHKWQKVLIPHMQTTLLKRLQQHPTPWTDLPLVEKELFERNSRGKTPV